MYEPAKPLSVFPNSSELAPAKSGHDSSPIGIPPVCEASDEEGSLRERLKAKQLLISAASPWLPQLPAPANTWVEDMKSKVWLIFEEPETCKLAFVVNVYIIVLILSSAVVAIFETLPGLHRTDETDMLWLGLEIFYVVNFTLEITLRLASCPSRSDFVSDGKNWIDFLSVAPFYLEMALQGSSVDLRMLRILRLTRALRLVKLARYSEGMLMISETMSESKDTLVLFAFFLCALLMVCASAIYYTERGSYEEDSDGEVTWYRVNPITQQREMSPYQSIPDSFWWVCVTLTTVGYGDVFPVTYWGQAVGFITQMLGVLTLALPLSIIGGNFHELRERMKDEDTAQNEADGSQAEHRHPGDALDDATSAVDECEEVVRIIPPICQALDLAMQLSALHPLPEDTSLVSNILPQMGQMGEGFNLLPGFDTLEAPDSERRAASDRTLPNQAIEVPNRVPVRERSLDILDGLIRDTRARTRLLKSHLGQ